MDETTPTPMPANEPTAKPTPPIDEMGEPIPSVMSTRPLPPRRVSRRPAYQPQPGIGAAFLWCIALTIVMSGFFIIGFAIDFGSHVLKLPKADRGDYLQKQIDEVKETQRLTETMAHSAGLGMATAQLGTFLFVIVVIRIAIGRDWRREIAFRLPSVQHLLLAIIGLPGFIIVANLIGQLLIALFRVNPKDAQVAENLLSDVFKSFPLSFAILLIGVAPGVIEELWCRGFLGRGLIARYAAVVGTLWTSFFFGLLHVDPKHVMITALMGLGLHLTYWATRSILVPMFIHFGNNAFAMLLGLGHVTLNEPAPNQPTPEGFVWFVAGGVGLFFTVAYAFYRSRVSLVPIDPLQPTWHSPYPSIMLPPSDVNAKLDHPPAGLLAWSLVALSLAAFMGGALATVKLG